MTDEVMASDIIQSNTYEYAKYVLSNIFPNPIDGMKKVKRRILSRQPLDESFSGMVLVSNTISIHPYGDSSIYDTACSMTNTFESTFPLLHLIGKGGSYSGDRAASARYAKFKITDFCKDIFFKDVNFKTIPMESTEDLSGREIQYFIPRIPTALLYENESIGFGYSSRTVPMKFENICDLVVDFINCPDKNNWNYSKLAKLFIPCLPIKVMITNVSDLIDAYSKGNFTHPIQTEGLYVISSNNSVLFRTIAYGVSPSAIRLNLTNAIRDKNHWLSKMDASFDALSEDKNFIDFRITIKRGGNIFDLIESIKGIIRLRTPSYPINNYVFNEKKVTVDPPVIIHMWYKERYRSIFGSKKHRQQELQLTRMRLETYLIICEHVDEVIRIIKTMEQTQIYKSLKDRFGLSTRQCGILLDANLQILMKSKRTELEEKLAKVANDLLDIANSFVNIDKEICAEVKALKKKYKTDTSFVSSESKYIGCLLVGDIGIIQVNSASSMMDTGGMFNGVNLRFLPYYIGVKNIKFNKTAISYNQIVALPFTTNSSGISIQYKSKPHLFVRSNGKSQCIPGATTITSEKVIMNHVSSKPLAITDRGKIIKAPEDLFTGRKHTSDVLYAFDEIPVTMKYVVISVNSAHPNVIRFQSIVPGKTKVLFSGAGETSILTVVGEDVDDVVVNLPSFHKYNIMYITDVVKHSKGILNDVNIRMLQKI